VYVDWRSTPLLFDARQQAVLAAFCHQSALSIENARLFADFAQAMQRIKVKKQYQDNFLSLFCQSGRAA